MIRGARLAAVVMTLGTAATAAAAPRYQAFMRAFRAQQYRTALVDIREDLEARPDDADLHAWLGISYSRIGAFADALPAFTFCAGSPVYENRGGIAAHADALRAIGRPEEAVALRRERLATLSDSHAELALRLGIVDDHRWAAEPLLAQDAAWEAIAMEPRSQDAWASLAEAQMDAGDVEEARATLWLTTLLDGGNLREHLAEARLAIIDGDLDEADRVLREPVPGRLTSYRHATMRAEIRRREGDPEGAILLLGAPRLWQTERPEMIAAMAAAYADAGDTERARELRDRGLALYPRDPDVLAAAHIVDAAGRRGEQ